MSNASQKPNKQPISILAVIHYLYGSVLLLNRCDAPGFWQSVTGSREGDETLMDTALREVWEETGIKATREQLCDWKLTNEYEIYERWRHRYPPGVCVNTEHVFSLCIARDTQISLQPKEHSESIWLPAFIAAEKVFSPSNKEAILMLPDKGRFDV